MDTHTNHEEQIKAEFEDIMTKLWTIQDEMDRLKTQMWRAMHRLGHALEEQGLKKKRGEA